MFIVQQIIADYSSVRAGAAIDNKKAEDNFPSDNSSCSKGLLLFALQNCLAMLTDGQEDVLATMLLPEIWVEILSRLSQVQSCLGFWPEL